MLQHLTPSLLSSSLPMSLSLSPSPSHAHTKNTLYHSPFSLSHSLTHTHTHSLIHTHTHTHTHSLIHSISFIQGNPFCLLHISLRIKIVSICVTLRWKHHQFSSMYSQHGTRIIFNIDCMNSSLSVVAVQHSIANF